jgi:hypothetical protein
VGFWEYECLECHKQIKEQSQGRGGNIREAVCRECSRQLVDLFFTSGRGLKLGGPLYCEQCEIEGRSRVPAQRSYVAFGLCESFYKRLGEPKLGFPKPKRTLNTPEVEPAQPIFSKNVVEDQIVDGRKLKIDWAQVQKDRDAGLTAKSIAKIHGCSRASIFLHTKSKDVAARRAEIAVRARRPVEKKQGGDFLENWKRTAISELEVQRDQIDRAIELVREI